MRKAFLGDQNLDFKLQLLPDTDHAIVHEAKIPLSLVGREICVHIGMTESGILEKQP